MEAMHNKPITMLRDELVGEIITAINKSNLSFFILEYVLKDILNEVHNGAVRQAQSDRAAYEQYMQEPSKQNADTDIKS